MAVLHGPGMRAQLPRSLCDHAMRTKIGRLSSSMRLRAWTATFTSVARRASVRERSPSPRNCLDLPMAASARARFVQPDAFCHAARSCLAMLCRWQFRCVGAVAAVSGPKAHRCENVR